MGTTGIAGEPMLAGPSLGFVLVHGGVHDARCWRDLIPHLSWPVVALDMPGRGGSRTPLADFTLRAGTDAIVEAIDTAPFDRAILVGHSLAGLTLPYAAAARRAEVAHLVFIGASIPPEGASLLSTITPAVRLVVAHYLRQAGGELRLPAWFARRIFCNDMAPDQVARTLDELVPEAPGVFFEPVSRADMPEEVPRTWVLLRTGIGRSRSGPRAGRSATWVAPRCWPWTAATTRSPPGRASWPRC